MTYQRVQNGSRFSPVDANYIARKNQQTVFTLCNAGIHDAILCRRACKNQKHIDHIFH